MINEAFTPSPADVESARRIVAAFDAAGIDGAADAAFVQLAQPFPRRADGGGGVDLRVVGVVLDDVERRTVHREQVRRAAAKLVPQQAADLDAVVVQQFPADRWQQISIFLSPTDVHVNRIPASGRVTRVAFTRGQIQSEILDTLTRNAESLSDVDFGRAASLISERLGRL